MFLSMLNETQKRLFLDFAHHMASIDGNYSNEEKEMVKSYCRDNIMRCKLRQILKERIFQ